GTLTDEQSTRFDELVEQIQKAQGDFAAEEKRYNAALSLDDTFEQYGKPADSAKRTPAHGEQRHAKSIGQQFADSEAVKQYTGHGKSRAFDVSSFYAKHTTQHRDGMGPDELKAVIQTGAMPADYIAPTMV